jgi:hypothetical protein
MIKLTLNDVRLKKEKITGESFAQCYYTACHHPDCHGAVHIASLICVILR